MERKAAQRYFSRVRRGLVCGREDCRRLLARCTVMMDDFQQENPEAGYDGLVAAFGEPEAFAAELLSSLESTKVAAARKRRRLIRAGVLTAVVLALIVISAHWYRMYRISKSLNEIIVAVEHPPQELTPEEYDAIWKSASEEEKTGVWEELPENTP